MNDAASNSFVIRSFNYLKNPFYYGKFEYPTGSSSWYEGKHDPLINKDLFISTQDQLKSPHKNRAKWGSKGFHFTQLITCGGCGSGITAEEKFKKLKAGGRNRYIYYRCSKKKDFSCNEKYLREEELVKQLLKIFNTINLKDIATKRRFQQELERFRKFARGVLGQVTDNNTSSQDIDIRMYAKYVLQEGTREEKQDILRCLNSKLTLKNKELTIS